MNRELLEKCREIIYDYAPGFEILIKEIEEELEKPEPKPVCYISKYELYQMNESLYKLAVVSCNINDFGNIPLYLKDDTK